MQLQLSVHPNCLLMGNSHYHIRAELPLSVVDALTKLATEARSFYFGGANSLGGLDADIYEYLLDEQTGKISWLGCTIEGVSISFTVFQESVRAEMSVRKEPEGMDVLDDLAFIRRMDGKLPGNYWIRPALIIRTLLGQTRH